MQIQDDKPYDDINITPMLDLAYVLLVIFILMCTATAQGLRANLPRPGAPSKSQPKNKPQIIAVLPDGSVNLNTNLVTLDQLQMQLSSAKAGNPNLIVIVRGESDAKYEAVVQVLNVLGELNIKQVNLATKARYAMQVQDDKPYDDINITPMLDLAYVLLVIFILMCTASVQGLKVNLPQGSSSSKSLAGQKIQAITVNKEGKYFLNTQPVTLEELGPRVASLKSANPQLQIVLKGEGSADYQRVMDVMNVLGQNGFDSFGIATKPEKK